jgi:hypothetical protein
MSRQDFGQMFFVNIFLGLSKSHYPVSRLARPGPTNEEKVKFVTTSREHTLRENVRFFHKSLSNLQSL